MTVGNEKIRRWLNNISANPAETVFLLFLFLYTYVSVLNDSLLRLTDVLRLLKWGVCVIGIILFFYRNKGIPPVKKLLFASVVLVAFVIAAKATGRSYMIVYAVFIIMAEGADSDKTVKTWLLSVVLALLTLLILCGLGVITDYILIGVEGEARHCLGFQYYSYFPFLVCFCSFAYIYLKKDHVNMIHYTAIFLVNLLMYYLTRLRLTFYLLFLFIILDVLLITIKKFSLNRKPVMVISGLFFPLGVAATCFAMVAYDAGNPAWSALNKKLSERLSLMQQGYLRYPISLFGNRFKMIGYSALRTVEPGEYFYIDSGFAYSLLGYGLIFTLVAVALYSLLCVYSCRTNKKHLFAWLTCVLIFTMINNVWVDLVYNPVLLLSFTAFLEICRRPPETESLPIEGGQTG